MSSPLPPTTPKPDNTKLTIDGVEVEFTPGTTLIQAAKKIGKYIPHFCYHEGLSIVGQCRMCFVEVEGAPKLATACSTPAAPGMKVHTQSEKVKSGQNATLEFTLLNHPLDCPICDRGGECKLQDYTYEFGPPLSRMIEEKYERDKHRPVSEQVYLDQERCILCTRCVRFSSEVDGRNELVVNQRGHSNVIDVFEGRPMQSNFSGNVVDLCPVGALTAKDFRFAARPWELKKHEGLCTGCSHGCNIEIHTKHRHPGIVRPDKLPPTPTIQRLMPKENLQVNDWWMCDKGRWGYHFHNQAEERITEIQIRRSPGSSLEPVSLREFQTLLTSSPQAQQADWEFWISDDQPHEGISWAKELMESWKSRGRKVRGLNPNGFSDKFLSTWKNKSAAPLWAGVADLSQPKVIVSSFDYRELEKIAPLVSLKLGQRLRKGQIAWEKRSSEALHNSKDNLEETLYLVSPPRDESSLRSFETLPANSKFLILWERSNARGLVSEGITPIESLLNSIKGQSPKGPVFLFSQTTQNGMPRELEEYLKKAPFVIVADSMNSNLVNHRADAVLPLVPLYETRATLTNLLGLRQVSEGVHLNHPNVASVRRGGEAVASALRLL